MEEIVDYLEKRIKNLIQECASLRKSNLTLQRAQADLTAEKETLLTKNKLVTQQIEKIVSELKRVEAQG